MKPLTKNRLIFLFFGIIIFILSFCNQPTETTKPKTITRTIEKIKTEVVDYKQSVIILEKYVEALKLKLNDVKKKRDTVLIVEFQDRIIERQTVTIDTLKIIVAKQDTIIDYQDTLIEIEKKKKNKWIKRTVITGLASVAGVVGTILILK